MDVQDAAMHSASHFVWHASGSIEYRESQCNPAKLQYNMLSSLIMLICKETKDIDTVAYREFTLYCTSFLVLPDSSEDVWVPSVSRSELQAGGKKRGRGISSKRKEGNFPSPIHWFTHLFTSCCHSLNPPPPAFLSSSVAPNRPVDFVFLPPTPSTHTSHIATLLPYGLASISSKAS